MTGTAIAQVSLVAAAPALTRLYEPTDLGAYFAFVAASGLVSTWAALRYELVIPLVRDIDLRSAFALCAVIVAVVAALSLLVLQLVGVSAAANEFGLGSKPGVLLFLPVSIAVESLRLAGRLAGVRRLDFKAVSYSFSAAAVARSLLQIGLGFRFGSLEVLIATDLATRALSAVHLSAIAMWPRVSGQGASMRDIAITYRRFPLLSAPATVVNSVTLQAPLLILSASFGLKTAADFGLVQRIATIPVALLGRSFMEVFYGEAAVERRQGGAELLQRFRRTVRSATLLGTALIAPCMLVAALAAPFAFGERFSTVGPMLVVMIPLTVAHLASVSVDPALSIIGRQDLHLSREVVRGVLTLGALVLTIWAGASPLLSVFVLALGGTLAYVIYVASSGWAIRADDAERNLAANRDSRAAEC